jgi:hypothetical protein
LAERTGFEPAVPLLAHTLSKRAPSTTRPSLRTFIDYISDTTILTPKTSFSIYII